MGLIKDIRLFEADWPNEDYFSAPYYMGKVFHLEYIDVLDVTERLVFCLRSRGFAFDGFDHLYVNFTTMLPPGKIQLAKRTVFREDAWMRWVDAGCDNAVFNEWDLEQRKAYVVSVIRQAVLFMAPPEQRELAEECIDQVMEQGERLWIPYKKKQNDQFTVEVLVRITDEPDYVPLLRVTDTDGNMVCAKELKPYDRDAFICQFSSFVIGKQSLRITPRKNYESTYYGLKPIKLNW